LSASQRDARRAKATPAMRGAAEFS